MILRHQSYVHKPGKVARKLYTRGTPYSINRRILDHLYADLQAKRITAMLLIEISRDIKEALYK